MCPSGQQMQSNSHGPKSPTTFWAKAALLTVKMWKTGEGVLGVSSPQTPGTGVKTGKSGKNAKIFLTPLEVKWYKSLFSDIPANMWTSDFASGQGRVWAVGVGGRRRGGLRFFYEQDSSRATSGTGFPLGCTGSWILGQLSTCSHPKLALDSVGDVGCLPLLQGDGVENPVVSFYPSSCPELCDDRDGRHAESLKALSLLLLRPS